MSTYGIGVPSREVTERLDIVKHMGLDIVEVMASGRGGVTILKNSSNFFALKAIDKSSLPPDYPDGGEHRVQSITREAETLQLLSDYTNQMYVANGQQGPVTWLLMRWVEGKSSAEVSKTIKATMGASSARQKILELFVKIVGKVADLHGLGYLHGDLQPRHFILDDLGHIHLVDFDVSQHKDETGVRYKGGLVHFNSPETARAILEKSDRIPLDLLTENYSLASVLFFLYTGKTSTFYGSDDYKNIPLEQSLAAIANGNNRSFVQAGADPFPELEHTLSGFLELDRQSRASDLSTLIQQLGSLI